VPRHLIKFRKAWECQDVGAPGAAARPLTLPLSDDPADPLPARARLSRTFGCPPLAWGRETMAVRLRRVPGLLTLRLNDHLMPLPTPIPEVFDIPLDAPLARNRLVLEVDFAAATPNRDGWGMIALAISSIQ
jgi:hypothetical protein